MTLTDLKPRRREVATLIGLGFTCPQIAAEMNISVHTVHSHIQYIASQLPTRLAHDGE